MQRTIEITYKEVPLVVEYEYDEGEPMVMYHSDLSGSPGEAPHVEIYDIFVEDTSIYEVFDDTLIDELAERILETYE